MGRRLRRGLDDKTVKLWDVTSGECLQTLEGHSSLCDQCVVFDSSLSVSSTSGKALLPNPEEFSDLKSKATPDVNGYVGFQNFEMEMKDDHAVASQSYSSTF